MKQWIVILNTCASEEEAEKVARTLLESRLAACINLVPRIRSYYHWKGKIESGEEWLLVIKSSRDLFSQVEAAIKAAHSYEVPEVISLPISGGSADYLDWFGTNLREAGGAE